MKSSLIVRRKAKGHIEQAFRWYAGQSPRVGTDFLNAIDVVLERIKDTPLLYAPLYRDIRRTLLPRFPYGVFCVVQAERIVVLAVLHTSRDPNSWPSHH